ncbi:MAG: hypothetical protein ACRDJN_23205 [Chloroflexota bacterium]
MVQLRGRVRDNAIVLDEPIGLPEGTEVELDVQAKSAISSDPAREHPLRRAVGTLRDANEWDDILRQIYEERKHPNRAVAPL